MTKLAILAFAALGSIAVAPQAWAQAANPEPGYCAQFYPNADCNSIGPSTPSKATAVEPDEEAAAVPAPVPTPKKKPKKKAQTTAAAPTAK
ncbi:MAG: hypothetical protein ACRED3_00250 [Bradyrhizobium sp.]